jgi:hypothetical protein
MKNKFLYWSPRILSLLFVAFLSVFALDVFGQYQGLALWLALAVHLWLPIGLLIVVIAAWKWDLVGAIVFFAFALYYVWIVGLGRDWSWYASISLPAAIIGILFLLNWLYKRE